MQRGGLTMRAALALLIGGLSLAGCTTTPMTVECDPFRTNFTKPVPRSATIAQIQADVPPSGAAEAIAPDAGEAAAYANLVALTLTGSAKLEQTGEGAVLALSGGGQWGAFGATYLDQLNTDGNLPRFRMVTGVSTGALQALFVGAAQAPGADAGAMLGQLVTEYTITDEDEVVHRGGYVGAAVRGSVAKLDPLRLKIEKALCRKAPANPQTADDCPLIKALGTDGAPVVLLGFVEARSGEMQAVNVSAIAQAAITNKLSMKQAQQCITGGALASVAMPFFYQQVQVTSDIPAPAAAGTPDAGGRTLTYYDGGVRQSMFLFESVDALARIESALSLAPPSAAANAPGAGRPVYMIRNGPTVAKVDDNADGKRGAIPTAERGYSLIVNQSEVTAIEAIRLRDDMPVMRVATADGYNRAFRDTELQAGGREGCKKVKNGAMFEPDFMACLRAFGRFKAKGGNLKPQGWILLTPQ
jgi:hypothetical protein